MRSRTLTFLATSAMLAAAALAPTPASAASVTVKGKCYLRTPIHQYCFANVGNTVEVSAAASPVAGVVTAGNPNIVGVFSTNPQDWVFRSLDRGRNWVSLPQPGVPGLFNEGDVAFGPSGTLYISWYDLSRDSSRLYFSRNPNDATPVVTESTLVGPQPAADRPWVQASLPATPGGPELALAVDNARGTTGWGSIDAGVTYTTLAETAIAPFAPDINVDPGADTLDPAIVASPTMDYLATSWNGLADGWTPLPTGGFLDTPHRRWLTFDGAVHHLDPAGPLAQLKNTPYFKIGSSGVVYQADLGGGTNVRYRYLKDGVWSAWTVVATLAKPPAYPGTTGTPSPNMAIQTHGDTLGFNTRDGVQDILIRVSAADTAAPVITRENMGGGTGVGLCDATVRYDYPTLVFDVDGMAAASFCGNGQVQEAYELA